MIDDDLLDRLKTAESNGDPKAVSKAGARGPYQFMPGTAKEYKLADPHDENTSRDAARQYLTKLHSKYGDMDHTLRAYNWGPGNMDAYLKTGLGAKGQPMPKEAIDYPGRVMRAKPGKAIEDLGFDIQPVKGNAIEGLGFESAPTASIPPNAPTPSQAFTIAPKKEPIVGVPAQAAIGAGKGLLDAAQGAAYLVPKAAEWITSLGGNLPNPVSRLHGKISQSAENFSKIVDPAYENTVGDSNWALGGRIAGNIVPSLVGGSGIPALSANAAKLWQTGGLVNVLKSTALAGGVGAAQGVATNVHTDKDSLSANATGGAAGGLVGQMAIPIVKAGVRGVTAIKDAFTKSGIEKIAGKKVLEMASDPANLAKAAQTPTLIPGVKHTTAELVNDPGLAMFQRILQSADLGFGADMAIRKQGNNKALIDQLRSIAGSDAEKLAVKQNREMWTKPLYADVKNSTAEVDASKIAEGLQKVIADSRRTGVREPLKSIEKELYETVPVSKRIEQSFNEVDALSKSSGRMSMADHDFVKKAAQVGRAIKAGKIAEPEAMSRLLDMTPKSIAAKEAIERMTEAVGQAERSLSKSPASLHSASQNIADMIAAKSEGIPVHAAAMRELLVTKKALDRAITKAEPSYGLATSAYADLSKPKNVQDVTERILSRATSGLNDANGYPKLHSATFGNILKDEDALIKQATGRKLKGGLESVFENEPQKLKTIQDIKTTLERMANADNSGAISGSRTAQLGAGQNFVKSIAGPLGFATLSHAPGASTVAQLLHGALKSQDDKVLNKLIEIMGDPNKAAAAALKYGGGPTKNAQQIQKLIQQAVAGGGALTGAAAWNGP